MSSTLAAEPPLAGLVIDNRILTSDAPCGTWYRDLQATLEPGRRLVLSGSLPAACGPRTWSAAPLPPAEFGSALVAALWSEVGGRLGGTVRDGRTPGGAEELFTDESDPLADVVRDMNKWTSNVIARQLLALVGAVNIPIIQKSVEWWNTLHQPATFKVTGKASMSMEMWLPLLLCVLGFYCFLGAVLLYRMRTEVLKREARSSWVRAEVARLVEGRA